MIRSSIISIAVIAAAACGMRETKRPYPNYSITEVVTKHPELRGK
jgi:hypothetical protein